jgi:hypothetical protein
MAQAAGWSLGAALGVIAGVRGGKAVHPHGVVYDAQLAVPGGEAAPSAAELLSRRGEHRAVVRFSRSVGLPRPIPDLLGVAIRVLDAYGPNAHQDFLLVSSADRPVLHHVFLPATDVQQRPYTSALPYRAGSERFLVGVLPDRRSPRFDGDNEFERLELAAGTGQLRFQLAVACLQGRFQPVAELRIGARLAPEADALRFNPWNTGGGMAPVGVLNGARDRAYKLSQAAWRRTATDGAKRQDAAEHLYGTGSNGRVDHRPD